MAPLLYALLPPASSRDAASSTRTSAPASRAAIAAHSAALPAPTTTTGSIPLFEKGGRTSRRPRRDPIRLLGYLGVLSPLHPPTLASHDTARRPDRDPAHRRGRP